MFLHSCLLRIIDSFGTEPAFNHRAYAKRHNLKSSWGMHELNPQQFYTMFRETPPPAADSAPCRWLPLHLTPPPSVVCGTYVCQLLLPLTTPPYIDHASFRWLRLLPLTPPPSVNSTHVCWLLLPLTLPPSTDSASFHWLHLLPLTPPPSTDCASFHWLHLLPLTAPPSTDSASFHWHHLLPLTPPPSTDSASFHWLRLLPLTPPPSTDSASRTGHAGGSTRCPSLAAHSPDNSFMGFVVESHDNSSESWPPRENMAVVYGKALYMWKVTWQHGPLDLACRYWANVWRWRVDIELTCGDDV